MIALITSAGAAGATVAGPDTAPGSSATAADAALGGTAGDGTPGLRAASAGSGSAGDGGDDNGTDEDRFVITGGESADTDPDVEFEPWETMFLRYRFTSGSTSGPHSGATFSSNIIETESGDVAEVTVNFEREPATLDTGQHLTTTVTLGGPETNVLEVVRVVDEDDDGQATFSINTNTYGQAPVVGTVATGLLRLDTDETYGITGASEEDEPQAGEPADELQAFRITENFFSEQPDFDLRSSLDEPIRPGSYTLRSHNLSDVEPDRFEGTYVDRLRASVNLTAAEDALFYPNADDAAELALRAESNVQITGATLDPNEIEEGRSVTQTLTMDVAGVSDDGNTDTFTLNFPNAIESVNLNSVTVEDAEGDTVAVSGSDTSGTLYTFSVSPDSNADIRDLTATVNVDVTVSDVSTDTTAEVTTSVSDSAHGSDSAELGVTIRDDTSGEDVPIEVAVYSEAGGQLPLSSTTGNPVLAGDVTNRLRFEVFPANPADAPLSEPVTLALAGPIAESDAFTRTVDVEEMSDTDLVTPDRTDGHIGFIQVTPTGTGEGVITVHRGNASGPVVATVNDDDATFDVPRSNRQLSVDHSSPVTVGDTLPVTVTDQATGEPVSDVTVVVESPQSDSTTLLTDRAGVATIDSSFIDEEGEYDISVQRAGFAPLETSFEATAGTVGGTELSLSPSEQTVTPGNSVTYDVVVGSVDGGVSSYDLNISIDDDSVARIERVSDATGGSTRTSLGPGEVSISTFGGDTVDSGTAVTIARVTVTGEDAGSAALSIEPTSVSDENGAQYTLDEVNDGTLTVIDEPTSRTDLSLSPSSQTVTLGNTATYDIVIGETSDGVGSFNLNVEAANPSTATIVDASTTINGTSRVDIANDNASVQLSTFAGDTVNSGTDVRIATVTVRGETAGSTELVLAPESVSDESGGDQYAIEEVANASVTVAADPVTVRLEPTEASVGTGGTTTLEIVAEGTEAGVGGYALTVNASNTATARIVGATTSIDGNGQTVVAPDGSGVRLGTFGGDTAGAGPVTIGTVTVEGVAPGSAAIPLRVESISDPAGSSYSVGSAGDATVTVRTAPDVTGDGNPATDPDSDGLYEDLNGDGQATPGDATVLFNAAFTGNAAVTENVALFDFNGDEAITPGDATVLFNEVF